MSCSASNVIKIVPSYSADLLLLCTENHCCLRSKLKSLRFLAQKNQPASRQVSWFLFIVLLIKLCSPYPLPDQSVHMLIVNKCSWISPFITFSVGMSGISPCTRDQWYLLNNNSCIFCWQRFHYLWVMHYKERILLCLQSTVEFERKRNDGLTAEIGEKQTSTTGKWSLNGKEVNKELKIWLWESLFTRTIS